MQFSARVNANSQFFMIIILTTVLFLICPLISILVAYWVLLRENKERCLWLFAVLMACYISFINISKSISSDLIFHGIQNSILKQEICLIFSILWGLD